MRNETDKQVKIERTVDNDNLRTLFLQDFHSEGTKYVINK